MKSALIEPEMILMIEKALKAITNEDFLAAITTAILLIILGFTLQKLKLFNEHSKKSDNDFNENRSSMFSLCRFSH